jgi:NAD(P)-dependent dehydrogenase (short-subunit alcohol dehydrogenase family)
MVTVPHIAGSPDLRLADMLATDDIPLALLVNADPAPDCATIVARCHIFADRLDGDAGGLIVTLLPDAPPGLAHFAAHREAAALWAFTRQAALEWAPRHIRVNAIGLGTAPFGPFEPEDQAGRAATANIPAKPASTADIARTITAMAHFPSMTGQIIRLGA